MTDDRRRIETGRGATLNAEGRFAKDSRTREDDGWGILDEPLPPFATTVQVERARTIISRNDSPDIPFTQSINPYRGCEHGCIFCFARPSHAYVDLSPGLDFESKLFYKQDAAALLEAELRKPGYRCDPINLGANTDPYQPIERQYRVTRAILEVLLECRHPVTIVTKGATLMRDLDLLEAFAKMDLVKVFVSVTSLDPEIKRTLEPRAAGPQARLRMVSALAGAGIPVGVMIAPVIPAITDHELEHLVEAAAQAGAQSVHYQMLRLPHEVKGLFRDWLDAHYPDRAAKVMAIVQDIRGGRDNDPRFGHRMRGGGEFAGLIAQRFKMARRKHGLGDSRSVTLRTDLFRVPELPGDQLSLLV